MDKLKLALQMLKKYHFWMLCLVVMVVGLYAWYSSAASLDQSKVANISEISKHKADVEAVSTMREHPNELVLAGIDAKTKALQKEVLEVWNNLYKRQREEVLFWPPELTEGFIRYIDSKKFGDPIPVDLLEQYQDTITERLKVLRNIIEAKPSLDFPEDELEPVAKPGEPAPVKKRRVDESYIVVWDNEGDIRKIIDWEETPTALKVWVAQEDLWVYEQMLNIIKDTNKGAKGPHNAAVTRIYSIEAGASAARHSKGTNRIYVDKSAGGGDAAAAEEPNQPPAEGLSKEEVELLDSRYIDGDGKPIGAGQPPDVKEYKRIPVRFDLRMDSREISRLIVNCSNAALPIEVRQVRINPTGRRTRRAGVDAGIGNKDLNDTVGRQEAMVRVEIHGIIYLFNPPDLERLELEPEAPLEPSQEQPGQGTPVAGEPASAPAPGVEPSDPASVEEPDTPKEAPAAEEAPAEDADPKNDQAPADPAAGAEEKTEVSPEKPVTPEDS